MRGDDQQQSGMFSYVSLEERVPQDRPVRRIREIVDEILRSLAKDFDGLYAKTGCPSAPPEPLLRAVLLQIFYTVRSERMLMEQMSYNLLFRWFVGLEQRDWKKIRVVRPSRGMLDQFLSLANANAERICSFARKSGVLAICIHEKPTSHSLDCDMAPCPEIDGWSEPLDRWRYYARQFQAVLRIADRLNANQLGEKRGLGCARSGQPVPEPVTSAC